MTYSLDHAAQELISRGYIRRLDKEDLYNFALRARDQLTDFFAVLGGQPIFDTEVEMIGLRKMDTDAILDRAEAQQADAPNGLFRGMALSFTRAVVVWFFRKQLDADLENGSDRTWMNLDEIMRGVAAYYPDEIKGDEAKFSRALTRTLTFMTNNNLAEDQNSARGQIWSAHPALRVALGADEMEDFTQQIIEALEKSAQKDSQTGNQGDTEGDEPVVDHMSPDHPDSPWTDSAQDENE